jgi:hypothetical protein
MRRMAILLPPPPFNFLPSILCTSVSRGILMAAQIELGLAYYGAGCFVESQEVLLEALQVTYSLFPYESTLIAAKLLNFLGCIQYDSCLLVSALDSFEESL